MSISKEQLEQSFQGKSYVDLKDLVQLIEENFGFNVTLQRKDEQPIFTEEQKKRMTSVIFKDEGVLSQLQQAQKDRKDGVSTYSDSEEEFTQLLKEAQE
ncbi:hypothetical protein H70357_10145 [Paenibacillus sp. FSL H7-0357]|uniref:hypothetical protein n=1 Tax=unclassified Paenibacillus TaxID=185978 RepID=UPI0004F637B5|nr:hypothetical protein [Paenibacillus sp. FSL H7-0357]AIQ16981.1 hypothetical protein H70357_10145 [Paenibacillus sp. FSL H7-0357]